MSEGDVPHGGDSPPSAPPTTVKADAHARLYDAGCQRLHINPQARCELWQNRHGKPLKLDFTDSDFQHCWTESLETALKEADTQPKNPFLNFVSTLFTKAPGPPKDETTG